jgi:ArsR family transcriptional regulator
MVEPRSVEISDVTASGRLAALADPLRLAIVGVLAQGEHCVCDIHERVPVAGNLLSYHLRVLREAKLLNAVRQGRWVYYRLDPDGFAALWAALGANGVPLPGETVATGRTGRTCADGQATL